MVDQAQSKDKDAKSSAGGRKVRAVRVSGAKVRPRTKTSRSRRRK